MDPPGSRQHTHRGTQRISGRQTTAGEDVRLRDAVACPSRGRRWASRSLIGRGAPARVVRDASRAAWTGSTMWW